MREENGSVFVEHGELGEFRLHVPLTRTLSLGGEGTAKVDPQKFQGALRTPQTGVDSPSWGRGLE